MSSASQSSAFPIKTLLIVLGIVGVVGLVIVLGCAGLIYLGWTKVVPAFEAVQTTADAFVQDIRASQLQSAYGRMSTRFQQRQPFPQFKAFVTQYPALTTYTSMTCAGINVSSNTSTGTQGTVRYTVIGPNNSLSFTLILVQEGGQWRVNDFTIP